MKGLINKTMLTLTAATAVVCGPGCYGYRDLVDPCWPDRYGYMARKEVKAALAPQVHNGHILDQTMWNYHFDLGTDKLTAGGIEHLAYLARRRPVADPTVYLQTAQDVVFDPAMPEKMAETREDLDARRIQAIQKFLTAQTAGQCSFQVKVHDPAEPGLAAIPVNNTVLQYYGRFRGGLQGGAGGGGGGAGAASSTGGAGVGGGTGR